ncbi:PGPGW domain-containing protein [Pseudoroseomonas cervicalis]|uniref:PGPGW domain-containing protein n=1 Tax=Teichococcus cervicalis TaxID=204525 RepID=UPI0022F191C6|nr:PGPGW domain-containing protein [Pseudoroseomonas cervicalis]WBV43982.1 hypothetical protein PFY06_05275 [Pseudoroseomonas cervicalis]
MLTYRPSWKRKLAGWSLLVLGVIGLVLPFLNGIIPLVLGLFVLREQHAWSQRSLAWCHARWPAQVDRMGALEDRLAQRCRNGTAWLRRQYRGR